MQTTRRTTSSHLSQSKAAEATRERVSLLRHLITTSLPYSPITASFFAERLFSLDHQREDSVYLLALTLHRSNRHHEAIHSLRQPVSCQVHPPADDQHHHPPPPQRKWNASSKPKPANEASLRCARLYASACLVVGREKEGREVLAKALLAGNSMPIPHELAQDLAVSSAVVPSEGENWIYELELARLAKAAREHERAIVGFRKVLEGNPWCWEALEGLCQEGMPPDIDLLFPPRPRPVSQPISPLPSSQSHPPNHPNNPFNNNNNNNKPPSSSHPPPLGPSQTFAVNSVLPRNRLNGSQPDDLGFFTPSDSSSTPVTVGGGVRGKAALFGGMAGAGKKVVVPLGAPRTTTDYSMDVSFDDSSFDQSFYPTHAPPPLSYVSSQQQHHHVASVVPPAFSNAHASGSNSLFTPTATNSSLATGVAPGVKRARGQQAPSSSSNPAAIEDDSKVNGKRPVRGVPSSSVATTGSEKKRDSSLGAPTRRSSRLSRDPAVPSSTGMAISRSQTSSRTTGSNSASNVAPTKKRTKNGTGPSVLSDAGSDILSPTSHSSSPGPSSPGASNQPLPVDPATLEAEDYVAGALRCFGRAAAAAAKFESQKAVEALKSLPKEQQSSWRCCIGLGKSYLEMLDYPKAEKAFVQARAIAPHLLDSMELYSTLLWHLRSPNQLSFLAQDLMTIAPRSPASWIAAGNVFSHLEDHSAALKCFKRAAQLDETCVYAYTLSGHECVVLEEWERALAFFREAVRLDSRHYNAWFGLGNVYMQTGKYRLAEYHFRRAVEINPTNATLVCCVGSVLEKLGQRTEALELYEKACLLAPDSPAVQFKRVRMWIALKHYVQAEQELLRLKDRAPNEFNVYFLLGKLCKTLDKKPEMLKYFGLAQDLEPRTASLIRETIQRPIDDSMEVDEGDTSGV